MNVLNQIMGVQEAGELWGLSPDRVKGLCQNGQVVARKIGQTWILDKNQPNPKKGEKKMRIKLTTLNGETVVVTADCNYMAQPILVEEALADGLTLQQMVDEVDGFLQDWLQVEDEHGWGASKEIVEVNGIQLYEE